jgi:hypothetical protein
VSWEVRIVTSFRHRGGVAAVLRRRGHERRFAVASRAMNQLNHLLALARNKTQFAFRSPVPGTNGNPEV